MVPCPAWIVNDLLYPPLLRLPFSAPRSNVSASERNQSDNARRLRLPEVIVVPQEFPGHLADASDVLRGEAPGEVVRVDAVVASIGRSFVSPSPVPRLSSAPLHPCSSAPLLLGASLAPRLAGFYVPPNCRTLELSNRRTALFPDRPADQGPAEAVAEVHPLPRRELESLPGGIFLPAGSAH